MSASIEDASGDTPATVVTWMSYVLFVGIAAILIALFVAPLFRVSNLRVVGATSAANEIQEATSVVGANVFTINSAAVLTELWRVPNIVPCGVTVSLPNTVTVCATLRKPVLGWETTTGIYLVDKFGRLISQVQSTRLPVVVDRTLRKRQVGQNVNVWAVTSARWVLSQMTHAAVSRFAFGNRHGLAIYSAHGWRAILGLPSSTVALAKKVATLKALISHGFSTGHPLTYADLTGANYIVRFRGELSTGGTN